MVYKITKKERVEVMVSLDKIQSNESRFAANINGVVYLINTPHFIIDETAMQQHCGLVDDCELTLTFIKLEGAHVQAVAQYMGKDLALLDGLAQDVYGPISPNNPKYFKFYMVNKQNTTFFLESKKGYVEFYVNLVDEIDLSLNWTNLYPRRGAAMF